MVSKRTSRNTLVIALLLFSVIAASSLAAVRSEVFSHQSQLLGAEKEFYVFYPRAYDENKSYPVLYLLHGAGGNYRNWAQATRLATYLENYDMFVVLPDGDEYGWYVDSPLIGESKYESYLPKELVPYIDEHLPTIPDKTGRAICGLSMGGHGAITLAVKYPKVFGSASSLSGIMDLTRHPNSWELPQKLGPLTDAEEIWKENSAMGLAKMRKIRRSTPFFLSCGVNDFAIEENRDFHQELLKLRVPHSYVEHPGSHDWNYWDVHIEEHLLFHDRIFKKQ